MNIYELLHDDKFYFIVSEFLRGGELYEYIVQKGTLSEQIVRKISQQLFLSLNYMHQKNIVHRDIKPENILIDDVENLLIKLTDFGFASYIDEKKKLKEVLGSPIYMPPEIVSNLKYDNKVDVWSAGIVTCILLTGKPPFYGQNK